MLHVPLALLVAIALVAPVAGDEKSELAKYIKDLASKNEGTRVAAAVAIGQLGEAAVEAAPKLVPLLDSDAPLCDAVYFALRKLGAGATPPVAAGLRSLKAGGRERCAFILADAAGDAAPIVDALVLALGDPESRVRHIAASGVSQIFRANPPRMDADGIAKQVPRLFARIAETDYHARESIVSAIAAAGVPGIRLLVGALNHKDGEVRATVVWRLAVVSDGWETRERDVVRLLGDDLERVRHGAAQAAIRGVGVNALLAAVKVDPSLFRVSGAIVALLAKGDEAIAELEAAEARLIQVLKTSRAAAAKAPDNKMARESMDAVEKALGEVWRASKNPDFKRRILYELQAK